MNTEKKPFYRRGSFYLELGLICLVFVIMFCWSHLPGGGVAGPDEPMRYDVAKWLYRHPGQLPRGDDPELINPNWGISYAFYPIVSYMISAVFMWIVALFDSSKTTLLLAARFAPTLFITIGSVFTIKTGKKLFGKDLGMLYACMVIFLPGYHYLGTYVNNDSLALMAAAIIFYAWAGALKEGWTRANCIWLSVGMGICFVSYYNGYGWILWSFFFFCLTILFCQDKPLGLRIRELFAKGIPIAAITLGISGWWFVRNYILYDGDIIGRDTLNAVSEKNALPHLKPSQHFTPNMGGWSLWDFLIYQDPGWPHNWLIFSLISFVGTFGHFDLYMEESVSKIYLAVFLVGFVGMLFVANAFRLHKRTVVRTRRKNAGMVTSVKTVTRERGPWHVEGVFHLMLFFSMLTPFLIFAYYAYFADLQAQGRYFISAVYAVIYFTVCGLDALLKKLRLQELIRIWTYRALAFAWVVAAVLNYFLIIVPGYR